MRDLAAGGETVPAPGAQAITEGNVFLNVTTAIAMIAGRFVLPILAVLLPWLPR